MITCLDNRFPFLQVAFIDNVATIIRDKSDTFLGNLDSCTLRLTQFIVDGASYDLAGGHVWRTRLIVPSNVSAKWLENAELAGSPRLEIKLSSCSTLGDLPVQYGLNIKTAISVSVYTLN